jgi:hypothetical protein
MNIYYWIYTSEPRARGSEVVVHVEAQPGPAAAEGRAHLRDRTHLEESTLSLPPSHGPPYGPPYNKRTRLGRKVLNVVPTASHTALHTALHKTREYTALRQRQGWKQSRAEEGVMRKDRYSISLVPVEFVIE